MTSIFQQLADNGRVYNESLKHQVRIYGFKPEMHSPHSELETVKATSLDEACRIIPKFETWHLSLIQKYI